VHFPDSNTPIGETLRALDDLIRQGKVRQIGCSNFSARQVEDARATSKKHGLASFVTCQDEYSLLVRDIERDRVPVMQKHGMTLLPYAPIAGGFLTGKYQRGKPLPKNARLAYSSHHASDVLNERNWDMIGEIGPLAQRTGLSMLEIAFGWLLAQPVTASVIAGASTPEQVEQNVRAGQATIPADVLAELDRITR
jgi:aryl-alcohol dehydrogenase-like predicted oxidoreductase